MIVAVMYPAEASFDFDYYRDTHLPLLQQLWGAALIECQPLRGVATADGTPPPYQVITLLQFSDLPALQEAMVEHGAEVAADLQNFTDRQPLIQINAPLTPST